MKKSIVINSKEYEVPSFDFGSICELEELGLDFNSTKQSFSMIRALVAYTMKCDIETASKEINEHIKTNSIADFNVLIKALTESDFFQNLTKKQ
jgi:hypothetical protein